MPTPQVGAGAPAPATPTAWATLTVATCNLLNLANPGRPFYPSQEPYSAREFERKLDWLGERLQTLNADILAAQEIWDEAAFKGAVHRSGLRYDYIAAPGAENHNGADGAQGTPRVGLATRLKVEQVDTIADFPAACVVEVPGLGPHKRYERPLLSARLRMKHGQQLQVITTHLKSKRPKFLQDEQGRPLEDPDDPAVQSVASLRALVMRAAEAVALRHLVIAHLRHTQLPLVLMGDFNDGPHSVTTQLIAATAEIAYDKAARDVALFNAWEVQGAAALRRDVAYSHIYQGYPEVLDQVLVSEEFVSGSRFQLGDVRRVEVFNDHLHEGRDRSRSDHGFVRALLRFRLPPNGNRNGAA